ncbi:isoprenoid synthase domain-containing protein [Infundibulicybe gibba]|nr:isoprenoid synthase domain-containing protein [Infundibulicybe gibba]
MRRWQSSIARLERQASFQYNPRRYQSTPTSLTDTLKPHLADLRTSMISLLTSGHPALTEITKYYFLHPSKHIRPIIILLLSQATNGLGSHWHHKLSQSRVQDLDRPLTRPDVLNDWNPSLPKHTASFTDAFSIQERHHLQLPPEHLDHPVAASGTPSLCVPLHILPTQLRLAQVVELIHAATLLHDDVIDASPLRRGASSAPVAFGNKLSVLGGNFILGRASAALARLGDSEVTELIASVVSNLVEGEILQMKDVAVGGGVVVGPGTATTKDAWNIYLQKTYLKTASLMAKGARAAVVLGGCKEGEIWREVAYTYGRNLGIAFQLVDDILDYESPTAPAPPAPTGTTFDVQLGKPGNGADLQLGLATGPALFAWEEHPEMSPLIARRFKGVGDAQKLVRNSEGIQRTRKLAGAYAEKAREVVEAHLPPSDARNALVGLTAKVLGRRG